jgi:hypothetical protein
MRLFKKKESKRYYIPEKYIEDFYRLYDKDLLSVYNKYMFWKFIFSIFPTVDELNKESKKKNKINGT